MDKRKMSKEIKRLKKNQKMMSDNLGSLVDVVEKQSLILEKMNGLGTPDNDLDAELRAIS